MRELVDDLAIRFGDGLSIRRSGPNATLQQCPIVFAGERNEIEVLADEPQSRRSTLFCFCAHDLGVELDERVVRKREAYPYARPLLARHGITDVFGPRKTQIAKAAGLSIDVQLASDGVKKVGGAMTRGAESGEPGFSG